MILTDRQRTILSAVAERYIGTGTPVSSKELAGTTGLEVSSSTVRNEFALLEELGYLTHPHTSAGRVPTDLGYREFVDQLMSRSLARRGAGAGVAQVMLSEEAAGEIDTALRQATEAMSRVSNLLALALAPRLSGARLSHVELLNLQSHQLMYVFIVSTGAVMKGTIEWMGPVDEGLTEWARTYLNEMLNGKTLTARLVRRVLANPDLSVREADFLGALAPAFERLVDEQYEEEFYVGGTARLLAEPRHSDVSSLHDLLALLEERVCAAASTQGHTIDRDGGGAHRKRARGGRSPPVLGGGGQLRTAPAEAGHREPGRSHLHGLSDCYRHGPRDGTDPFRACGRAL